jgi:alkanesulfonate monooxygenase SsuD/methylene tetrahydromethanopterin reductase-like flavin-dependent oxidoreductase (luciferase family)
MVDFPEMMTWPKPVQKPYPPILVGGGFPQAARRAIRYATAGARSPVAALACSMCWRNFGQMARDAGRDPQSVPVSLFNPAEDESELARYRDMGIAASSPSCFPSYATKSCPFSTAGRH